MKIAVLADVHGNLLALEAVIQDLQAASPDLLVNLGDLVSGPFDPAGSADAQIALDCPTLAGNHERQLLTGGAGASDAFAKPLLSPRHWEWIRGLSPTLTLLDGDVHACHGSPAGGDLEYLLEDVASGSATLAPADVVRGRLVGIQNARVVLCGHTHIARVVNSDGILVVNPGSVGMPAYRDDDPVPHAMEAGSPHARYAMLTRSTAGWSASLCAVAYDFEAAARQAERNGRPATAFGIRTGRVPPGS